MTKTVKFTISMSASEFKALEVARNKAGKTRSQFVRESILKANDGRNVRPEPGSVREDPGKIEAWMEKYPKDKTMVFY